MISLEHGDAEVLIEQLPLGHSHVRIVPKKKGLFISVPESETGYPPELIKMILDVKGPAYLCDELRRDEDPQYLQLDCDLHAYFDPIEFQNKRILDFGCGAGASTMNLARSFPASNITGVELCRNLLAVARKRNEFYRFLNIDLIQSPSGTELPPGLGQFDFVIMCAVYEHLLPEERKTLVPELWNAVRDNGYLVILQTPNRMCPLEGHTTGLPLLNYLPKPLAMRAARRFSNRIQRTDSWENLLRQGIRGATERGILRNLSRNRAYQPMLLEPGKGGFRDRVDLWYSALNPDRRRFLKRIARLTMKVTWYGAGITFMPNLTLVIRKTVKSR
jgi:2-polyprenyl-3-methyl-5-hydroxy-6-metoxy-1,4-benzoquinol methylase